MAPSTKQALSIGTLVTLGIASVSFIASIGAARFELSLKEDRSAHDSTLALVQREARDSLLAERFRLEIQHIRDSAQLSSSLLRITDVACEQNPRRSYCRGK